MNNPNINNMLNKIDELSKQIKDEDYKYLLEQLKEIKEDYEVFDKQDDKYYCMISFVVKHNILKHIHCDIPNHVVIDKDENTITLKYKLSKQKIKKLCRYLNQNINNFDNCVCEDINCPNNNECIEYIIYNIREMFKITMDKHIKIDYCDDCVNGICDTSCGTNDTMTLNTINTIKTLEIILVNIEFRNMDFMCLDDECSKDTNLNMDLYRKHYADELPFNKYIDRKCFHIDNLNLN